MVSNTLTLCVVGLVIRILRLGALEEARYLVDVEHRVANGSSMNTKPPGRASSIIRPISRISDFITCWPPDASQIVEAHHALAVEVELHGQPGLRQDGVVVFQMRRFNVTSMPASSPSARIFLP